MIQGLNFAIAGLLAAQTRQNVSANNVANINTAGFKAKRADQVDVAGGGTKIGGMTTDESEGGLVQTGRAADLAIAGKGFFRLSSPRGDSFARAGAFYIDSEGYLAGAGGLRLSNNIQVPEGATNLQIGADGAVSVTTAQGGTQQLGRISLYSFADAQGLLAEGDNLFGASASSGPPVEGAPGEDGLGQIVSGMLEDSNVDLAREMTNQIVNAAAFRANVASIRAEDEMLGTIIDLRR